MIYRIIMEIKSNVIFVSSLTPKSLKFVRVRNFVRSDIFRFKNKVRHYRNIMEYDEIN